MSQCPSIFAEYFKCSPGTEYDAVQIWAALDLKWEHQPVDYGSMTAVIRYKTPYIITNTSPLNIFFALGTDVALRSVLGITSLLAMGAVVDLAKGQFVCLELNKEFMLQLDPPGKGIPDGSTLESFSAVVPDEVPSHIPTLGFYSYNILHPMAQLPQYLNPLILVIL